MTSLKKSQQPVDVESLLKEASSPDTDNKRLREIWSLTKSVRVRKAIASNPNIDSKMMSEAARLYIREVVENESFEISNLFTEDKLVKTIYEAYTNPSGVNWTTTKKNEKPLVARALVVSPRQLNHPSLLFVCAEMSKADLIREMKDPEVRRKMRRSFNGNLAHLHVSTQIYGRELGLVEPEALSNALAKQNKSSSYVTKGTYLKMTINQFKKAQVPDSIERSLVYNMIRCSPANQMKSLVSEVLKNTEYRDEGHLLLFNSLYRQFLDEKVKYMEKGRNTYMDGSLTRHDENDHAYYLSKILWSLVLIRNCKGVPNLEEANFETMFEDLKLIGFDKDFGPYRPEMDLNSTGYFVKRAEICEKLLNLKDDRTLAFYMVSGLIWGSWFAKGGSGLVETKLVNRMHRINQREFEQTGKAYYNHSYLDVWPEIGILTTNGLDYDIKKYHPQMRR